MSAGLVNVVTLGRLLSAATPTKKAAAVWYLRRPGP